MNVRIQYKPFRYSGILRIVVLYLPSSHVCHVKAPPPLKPRRLYYARSKWLSHKKLVAGWASVSSHINSRPPHRMWGFCLGEQTCSIIQKRVQSGHESSLVSWYCPIKLVYNFLSFPIHMIHADQRLNNRHIRSSQTTLLRPFAASTSPQTFQTPLAQSLPLDPTLASHPWPPQSILALAYCHWENADKENIKDCCLLFGWRRGKFGVSDLHNASTCPQYHSSK